MKIPTEENNGGNESRQARLKIVQVLMEVIINSKVISVDL